VPPTNLPLILPSLLASRNSLHWSASRLSYFETRAILVGIRVSVSRIWRISILCSCVFAGFPEVQDISPERAYQGYHGSCCEVLGQAALFFQIYGSGNLETLGMDWLAASTSGVNDSGAVPSTALSSFMMAG